MDRHKLADAWQAFRGTGGSTAARDQLDKRVRASRELADRLEDIVYAYDQWVRPGECGSLEEREERFAVRLLAAYEQGDLGEVSDEVS